MLDAIVDVILGLVPDVVFFLIGAASSGQTGTTATTGLGSKSKWDRRRATPTRPDSGRSSS